MNQQLYIKGYIAKLKKKFSILLLKSEFMQLYKLLTTEKTHLKFLIFSILEKIKNKRYFFGNAEKVVYIINADPCKLITLIRLCLCILFLVSIHEYGLFTVADSLFEENKVSLKNEDQRVFYTQNQVNEKDSSFFLECVLCVTMVATLFLICAGPPGDFDNLSDWVANAVKNFRSS